MNICYSYISEKTKTFYNKHYHSDMWEIIYMISGNATLEIDGVSYNITQGDIAVIPPNTIHNAFSKETYRDHYIHVRYMNHQGVTVTHDYDEAVGQLMSMIDTALRRKKKNYDHTCDRLIDAICEYIQQYSKNNDMHSLLIEFKDRLHENLANSDFKIGEEIVRSGYNPDYFRRSFKTEFEYTPHEYLTNLRLDNAAGMLLNECPGDVKKVCVSSGFNDISYFSKLFKSKYGTSPLKFSKIDIVNPIPQIAQPEIEDPTADESETENEQFILMPQVENLPFNIVIAGVTYPDSNYHLIRENSHMLAITYVESGKGIIITNRKTINVKAGDIFIMPIDHSHELRADKNDPFKTIWFNSIGSLSKYLPQIYGIDKIIVFPNSEGYKYVKAIREACLNPELSVEDKQIQSSELFFRLIHLLSPSRRSTSENHIDASVLKTHIDNHIKEQISLDDLSKVINRSVSQMLRIFKTEYNCTPYEYILNQKMTLAKHLLLSSDMKIKEISDELSFKDEHYFSTLFKSRNKYTPTQFRKMKNINLNYK